MLNYFVRDLTYFQTVRNNRDLNTGYIYDTEFSKLQNYINNKIIPTINSIKFNKVHGVVNSDGYLLRTIGNQLTKFDRVQNADIPNKIITFNRLSRITPNSMIYHNQNDLISIPYVALNTTLVNKNDNCTFQKIVTANIRNSSISSTKVRLNVLDFNHLSLAAINSIVSNAIPNIKILDSAIDQTKLADKAITESKLNDAVINLRNNLNLTFIRQNVTGLVSDRHIIKSNHIGDNSVDFADLFQVNRVLQDTCIINHTILANNNASISPYSIFYGGNPITKDYILDRSFSPRSTTVNGISKAKLSNLIKSKLIAGGLVG